MCKYNTSTKKGAIEAVVWGMRGVDHVEIHCHGNDKAWNSTGKRRSKRL